MGAGNKMLTTNTTAGGGQHKSRRIKIRHLIAILATLCPVVCYISRQNLSMAIVAMVNEDTQRAPLGGANDNTTVTTTTTSNYNNNQPTTETIYHQHQHQHQRSTCPFPASPTKATQRHEQTPAANEQLHHGPISKSNSSSSGLIPTINLQQQQSQETGFNWTSSEQSLVLGAFFWTYVIFQIPAARFAEQIGAKWILATATIGSSILSLISPWAASTSVYALFLVRALMGVCQTALYPACYVLYSHWLPPLERSQALPILCVGAYLGSIVASTSTGYFIQSPDFGWEFAFYVPSVLCAIWSLFWVLIGASEPRQHRSISMQEIEYIESKMETTKRNKNNGANQAKQQQQQQQHQSIIRGAAATANTKDKTQPAPKKQISWLKLFKSKSIWAMIVAFFASNWSFSIVLLLLPTYLNDILHIEPLENGMINSTIYILYCISSPIVGSVSTLMVETRPFGISRLNVRKLFQGIALFGQSLCFILIPLIGCDKSLVMATLFMQIILFSCVNGGEVQLPTELSADFSGTIYAIGNCVGSSTGFIVPSARSLLISDTLDRGQWANFFYAAALISALGGTIFVIFGRNELRDYSTSSDSTTSLDDHANDTNSINKLKLQLAAEAANGNINNNSGKFNYIYRPARGKRDKFDLIESANYHHQLSGATTCCGPALACKGLSYRVADNSSR